ncbi:hypothetical protein [Sorangium sp. So ce1151]|uniref:hypothetical protein n=1 Tax=Sorangium sp. So ce1151 TaxID=3133332 RepID=UPI003F5E1687
MSGIELLRQLRADPALKSTLVVVLTSSTDDAAGARADALPTRKLTIPGRLSSGSCQAR